MKGVGAVRQKGLTVVEILVALAIGSVLLAALGQVYVASKQSYRLTQAVARVQENGRFALSLLAPEVRMAGYTGCRTIPDPVVIANPAPSAATGFADGVAVEGEDNVAAGFTTPSGASPVAGTDVVTVRGGAGSEVEVSARHRVGNANVSVVGSTVPDDWAQDDVFLITDCEGADVFRGTNQGQGMRNGTISHGKGNNDNNRLSHDYDETARILRFQSMVFYVADTGRETSDGEPVLALHRDRLDTTGGINNFRSEELIAGIANMQILYGEDTDDDLQADQYLAANAVSDFGDVVSVRLALLADSITPTGSQVDTATYDLLGEVIDPADDRRLRRAFVTTITLRNRVL